MTTEDRKKYLRKKQIQSELRNKMKKVKNLREANQQVDSNILIEIDNLETRLKKI